MQSRALAANTLRLVRSPTSLHVKLGLSNQPLSFPLQAWSIRRTLNSMNPAGLILASLFAGGFLVIIVGGLATLIYLHIQFKKQVATVTAQFAATAKEITESITGARTSFGGIRQDVKTALTSHENQVGDVLAKHQKAFEETVGRINGVALEAACAHVVQASKQIAGVAVNLQRLLYPVDGEEEREPVRVPLAPEEYAPDDTIYSGQTSSARMDRLADAADAVEHMSDNASV